jgi:hypothetical protein
LFRVVCIPADFDDDASSVYSDSQAGSLQEAPQSQKVSSPTAGVRNLAGLMRSLMGTKERRNSQKRTYLAASAGVEAECSCAMQLVTTLQQQCQAVEHTYNRLKQLRTRLAPARNSSCYNRSSKLLHTQQLRLRAVSSSGCCSTLGDEGPQQLRTNSGSRLGGTQLHQKQQRLQLAQHRSSAQAQQPSLPALTVVVRTLLQLAELQASPAAAAALRQQLLQQVKAAAAAARFARQPFSVAVALHRALPWLRAAVRQVCSEAVAAAEAAAAIEDLDADAAQASTQPDAAAAAATLERALSAAAEEVLQLSCSDVAAGQQLAGSSSMDLDMDALLTAEMTAALSATD